MIAQSLKKSILQEAISGRLVPQIESEGTAEDILREIAKQQKKNFTFSEIPEDEQPFAIPSSWKWVKLGEIVNLTPIIEKPITDESWILDLEDIEKDTGVILQKKKYKDIQSKSEKKQFVKGNVLYSKLRPYLNKVVLPDEDGFCTSELVVMDFGIVNNKYAHTVMMSPYVIDYSMQDAYGVKMPRANMKKIWNLPIPLPPLAEQVRIVEKLETLLPKIDSLEKTETRLSSLESTLGERLWKSVLQEAISGRLTTQQPSDGSADDLLEQIKAAHREAFATTQKKYKPLTFSQIPDSEIPFDIPENWKWVRLGEIVNLTDGIRKTDEKYNNLDARYLRGKAEAKQMTSGKFVHQGDDIILVDGENSGEVFTVPEDGYMGSTFKQLVILTGLNKDYIKLFILSKKDNLRNSKKGSAIPHLNKELFFSFPIPLPPLSEQLRIVTKLEKLRSALDKR